MVLTKIGASLAGGAHTINVTQISHTFVSGDRGKAVRMNNNSGTPQYVLAIASATSTADAIGIIINVADGNNFIMALSGRITVDACVPDLAAGTVLFLSHTAAGVLTTTEPSAAGHVSKPMAVITIANSEMIMLQQRGEVISSGATANHTVASHSDTTGTGAELETLTDGSTTTLHSHAAAGASTSWISAGEFVVSSATTSISSGVPYAIFADAASQTSSASTQVPTGKTGISSIKISYKNATASSVVVLETPVSLLTVGEGTTSNRDYSKEDNPYTTSSTTGTIEEFTLNANAFNEISTFAAGEIITVGIGRLGAATADTYGASWFVLGILITWS
jgi:hypothetical protein